MHIFDDFERGCTLLWMDFEMTFKLSKSVSLWECKLTLDNGGGESKAEINVGATIIRQNPKS